MSVPSAKLQDCDKQNQKTNEKYRFAFRQSNWLPRLNVAQSKDRFMTCKSSDWPIISKPRAIWFLNVFFTFPAGFVLVVTQMQKARHEDSQNSQIDTNSSKTIRGSVWCKWIKHVASLTATQRRELYLSLPKLFGTDKSLRQKRTNLEKLLQEKVFSRPTTTECSSPIGYPCKATRRILYFVMHSPQSYITELLRSLQNDNESTSAMRRKNSG